MSQNTSPVEIAHPSPAVLRVLNPTLRFLMRTPLGGGLRKALVVLKFAGRKSGRPYEVVITPHRLDGQLVVLTDARWGLNFRGGHDLEWDHQGRTTSGHGVLVEEPHAVGEIYQRVISELGPKMASRRTPLKVTVPRVPTVDELAEFARANGLYAVRLS
ncbi:MAG TPA: hypothetical protein VHC18_00560 [Amycolatopsis sp.]|nr:hypothetical protein [Amycolatopsis sp.]